MNAPRRVVILGKTGAGKSSLANTTFGEEVFKINHTSISEIGICQAETKSLNERRFTLIDTPGFFDTNKSEEELKPEILRCITECAPGPHAFLIMLKVEKFTEHEQAVVAKVKEYFSEEAFGYATVVFTHGDQLQEGQTIEDFVQEDKNLRDLVTRCGGRCHVIDNKYWNKEDKYRSNRVQIEQLFKTIDKTIEDNKDGCYTNETLQAVEKEIQQEIENIGSSSESMSEEEIRKKAKGSVFNKLKIVLAGAATGALLGALFGAARMVKVFFKTQSVSAGGVTVLLASAAVGAVIGGVAGFVVAGGAETPREAVTAAANAVTGGATGFYEEVTGVVGGFNQLSIKKLE